MTLEVCEKNRIAYYWLSREEKDNVDIQNGLKNEYGEWRSKGYKVCTFVSGSGNLVDLTKELLIHNKLIISKKMTEETEREVCNSRQLAEI